MTTLLGISGSLRKGSYNSGLLRATAEQLPDDVALQIAEIRDLPFYDADIEGNDTPAAVARFVYQVNSADALLIATPEYNYSISAVLKNAIDWASRPVKTSPLNSKPVAIMGAGGMMGTVRAQLHLRQILMHNGALVLPKPELYVARAREKFDAEGNLVDEQTREMVRQLTMALLEWTARFHMDKGN